MKSKTFLIALATLTCGITMWIIAGLWHNLILPAITENVEAHHEGIGIMLIAYIILAFLMTWLFTLIPSDNSTPLLNGLKLGIIAGILWVFPHGLVMAGAHGTSIFYEIKNTLWHIVEQGIGGIVIALFYLKKV
jgi:hypothetical protein